MMRGLPLGWWHVLELGGSDGCPTCECTLNHFEGSEFYVCKLYLTKRKCDQRPCSFIKEIT